MVHSAQSNVLESEDNERGEMTLEIWVRKKVMVSRITDTQAIKFYSSEDEESITEFLMIIANILSTMPSKQKMTATVFFKINGNK